MKHKPEGYVTIEALKDKAVELGQPVLYYLIEGGTMHKMQINPDGTVHQRGRDDVPYKLVGKSNDLAIRFENYFLAYAYMLRLRDKRMKQNEAMA